MKKRAIILCVCIGLLPNIIWGAAPSYAIKEALNAMMAEFPESTLLDIYKSSFQNRYGPGHVVADVQSAKKYLDWELQQPFRNDVPLWEPTLPDGRFVRVNLSVITDSIVPYDVYFDAFLESVRDIDMPPVSEWAEEWGEILATVESMGLQLPDFEEDKGAIAGRLAAGVYEGRHSSRYSQNYAPHYRLMRKDIFEERIKPLIDAYTNARQHSTLSGPL